MLPFAVYSRDALLPATEIQGPAIVEEGTSSTVIHSDQSLTVDEYGHLLLETEVS